MKDIYELLNDTDIDETEFIEMEVTEKEKAKVKKALRKSINKKRKKWNWKRNALVASIVVGISTTTLGLTFPAYASSIPLIGDIFRFIDDARDGYFSNYKEFSTEMNVSEVSNGVNVTINDVVFDGHTVVLTYSMVSEHDLGEEPYLSLPLSVRGVLGASGGSQIKRVDENHYVGLITRTLNGHEGDIAKIKWNIDTIINLDTGEEIKGKWDFALAVKSLGNQGQLIYESSERNGVKVNIEKISVSPISLIVHFNQEVSEVVSNQWDDVSVELEIRDDLGNRYSGEVNGGSGKRDSYDISWSATYEKLDPNATKLIVKPHVIFRNVQSGGVEITKNGEEKPIPEKVGVGSDRLVLDDIIIELNK
ncbi:DUF4179 domain-containing protein [Sutcliffiella halmapala]|uniref:DUF4179 domain-containing protein n=1 Tax=Sutcliffiella halmapala TaxID=79882 RepID=UPI000994D465|nr:DUF4179 domain-containing protein [Sutcliffiella halmapala]